MPLYAGVCETDITPPLGVWMSGYAFRPSGCVAIHDALYARALALDNGQTRLILLAMDLIGLDFDLVQQVREGISAQTGAPVEAIMLNATHTHGGPSVRSFNAMGPRDPAYVDVLVRKLIGIGRQAASQMEPATLACGRAPVQIGVNRRQVRTDGQTVLGHNYAGPVAPWVDALVVRDSRGEPFALLFCHACHPTTLGGDNLQITADFCGYACDYVRRETYGEVMPFFLQGCAGNINPIPRSTFEAAERIGVRLGAAAVEAMQDARPLDSLSLDYAESTVALPVQAPPSPEECAKSVQEWEQKLEEERQSGQAGRIHYAEGMLHYAKLEQQYALQERPDLTIPFAIQRLTVGGAQILGMPAEMFVQYALDFAAQANQPVFPLAYTNGIHGYMPGAADYPYGGYEVSFANRYYHHLMFTPECERLIRQTAYELQGIADPDWTPYTV